MSEMNKLIEKQIKDAKEALRRSDKARMMPAYTTEIFIVCGTLIEVVENQQRQIALLNERCDTQRGRDDDQQRAIETLAIRLNAMEVQR